MDRHFDDQGFNDSGLKTRPSELFQRNCWISFEPVEGSLNVLADYIGPHKIMWATDYPHRDGFFPGAPDMVRERLKGTSPETTARRARRRRDGLLRPELIPDTPPPPRPDSGGETCKHDFSGTTTRRNVMSGHGQYTPTEIRAKLNHPVIDGDGHWVEYDPVFAEQMRKVGGDKAADGFLAAMAATPDALKLSVAERKRRRVAMPGFWTRQTGNTLDRATAMMPQMLYDRLDEIGIDFAIIYPTAGLRLPRIEDDETRRAVIRAYNIVSAEIFREAQRPHDPGRDHPDAHAGGGDRGTRIRHQAARLQGRHVRQRACRGRCRRSTGTIPTSTASPCSTTCSASTASTITTRSGRSAVELEIAPTFHSGGSDQALRNSPTNFTYNHIGHFAAAGHAVAKGMFLGGVTRRFPELRFAFLEGGVGWGCQLFGDLIEHWERRGTKALENMKPEKLDRETADEPWSRNTATRTSPRRCASATAGPTPSCRSDRRRRRLDDFAACKITRKEDWIDLFAKPYYFGCEADDRMNATAFGKLNPFGAQLNAIYSSDIGHFDVIDMREPLPEAYELVEDGHITDDDFRDFVFANAVRLWGTQNPDFFEGTLVAKEAAAVLNAASQPRLRRRGEVGPGQTPPPSHRWREGCSGYSPAPPVGDQYRPAPEGNSLHQGNFSFRPRPSSDLSITTRD